MRAFVGLCFSLLLLFDRTMSAETIVIQNATLYPINTPVIQKGSLVIQDGKIQGVGETVSIPDGATILDGQGLHVIPGIIDSHSHMGVYPWPESDANSDGNEMTDPISPHVDALDSLYPEDPAFDRAAAGGVTTVMVLPGSGNLMGGKAVTVHVLPDAKTVEEMIFQEAPRGLKMALGENPKRVYGSRNQFPSTRMGNMYLMREAFTKTLEYREQIKKYNKDHEGNPPARNLKWETLGAVLDGKIRLHVHCYRADEMLNMIRLADEFKFKISSFQHSLEAYKVADVLAARGIGAATWADWWGFKVEAWTGIPWNAAYLVSKGVTVNLHSDSANIGQRLNVEAAKTLKFGMNEADALKTITLFPAQMLGIEKLVGSLEKGKYADIAIYDGPPLSIYSHVIRTMVRGKTTYERPSNKAASGRAQ